MDITTNKKIQMKNIITNVRTSMSSKDFPWQKFKNMSGKRKRNKKTDMLLYNFSFL